MKKLIIVLAAMSVAGGGAMAATYDGVHISGLKNSFTLGSTIYATVGLAYDPSSQINGVYNRIYLGNNAGTGDASGLYSADVVAETYSGRLAFTGHEYYRDNTVDSAGNVYAVNPWGGDGGVWKVTDPTGSATETRMISGYGNDGDGDPYGIGMVPSGFGGGYEAGADLLVYDIGLNDNKTEAISVVDKNSTSGTPLYTQLWAGGEPDGRFAVSEYDAKGYVVTTTLKTADLGGITRAYVVRVDSAGTQERVFLDIAATEVAAIDNAIEIDPADGSLWMPIKDSDGSTYNLFRVDVGNAVATNGDFVASVDMVIEDMGYTTAINGMAISPDGAQLAIGVSTGQDTIYVYDIIPEPATMGMFALLGAAMLWIRRKFAI